MSAAKGKVYLVGAGPGDPKLITLRGWEAIRKSDVLVYDRLSSPRLLKDAKPEAQKIYVGKLPDRHTLQQEEINQLLLDLALQGKVVTRLKGGDPAVFGRVGEEAEKLAAHDVPFEIVPGITSAIAVPAYAGIPVTHRSFNSSFAVVTGHEDPQKTTSSIQWEKLATATETLIFLMGVNNLPFIVAQLLRCGRDERTPVALIRWGTHVEQETLTGTLSTIVEQVTQSGFSSPAVIVVGEVVNLRGKLSWYEKKPLFGRRVLVTRARSQASKLSDRIDELGGEAVEFPVIRLAPPQNPEPLDRALDNLPAFDWVIFTSANGVLFFFRRLRELRKDIRELGKAQIAAIGPNTAKALEEKGLNVSLLPEQFQAERLIERLAPQLRPGMRVLLPRADIAREVLPRELRRLGVNVVEADAYDTLVEDQDAEEIVRCLREKSIHIVTFTSSSTVRNFVQSLSEYRLPELMEGVQVASIGPITSSTCRELGLTVTVEAKQYTIDGLVDALLGISVKEPEGR